MFITPACFGGCVFLSTKAKLTYNITKYCRKAPCFSNGDIRPNIYKKQLLLLH